ncbi:MAG: NAD(P)/FAD-dependent oxidoreductase [Bacteroidetes bacterium]|nr:NAD(P)/FAD-dependent oxidoreductase [Bacteroidota bacterium]
MDLPILKTKQKRVVIVGGGFAGIQLAKKLSPKYFQAIIVDKNNYHQFQPLLYQVATGGLEPSSISFPLRKIYRDYKNVFLRVAEAKELNTQKQILITSAGEIPYDYLVMAHGAITNYFGNDALQQNAFSMKSVSEALLLRNTLLQNYEKSLAVKDEEKQALLNVVIVGGGPTGVELAGAIAEMRNNILPKEYTEVNFRQMHIYLIEAAPALLSAMSATSSSAMQSYLKKMGVEVITETVVKNYDGKNVQLSNGNILQSNCLIWAAGVKGFSFAGIPENAVAPNGRMLVNDFNEVEGLKNIFVIGDAALMKNNLYPKGHPQVAPVAIQQATWLAKNLNKKYFGETMQSFIYKDKGTMATAGRNKAVAEIKQLKLKGFFAWFTWMAVHLMSIIGVKNRFLIFINWVWQYFTYDSSLRLIIKPATKNKKTVTGTKNIFPLAAGL